MSNVLLDIVEKADAIKSLCRLVKNRYMYELQKRKQEEYGVHMITVSNLSEDVRRLLNREIKAISDDIASNQEIEMFNSLLGYTEFREQTYNTLKANIIKTDNYIGPKLLYVLEALSENALLVALKIMLDTGLLLSKEQCEKMIQEKETGVSEIDELITSTVNEKSGE